MARTEIYLKSWCFYCERALALLKREGVDYKAIDLTLGADDLEQEFGDRSGRTTVPQSFIDGQTIGGYDDIAAFDAAGRLGPLLFSDDVPCTA